MSKIIKLLAVLTVSTFVLGASPAVSATTQNGQATISKDTLLVTVRTYNTYRGDYDVWSWGPEAVFNVNGPIPSGGGLFVEYTVPGSPPLHVDCRNGAVAADYWQKVECPSPADEKQSSTYTGPVNFAIKLRNELMGTPEVTLFKGRMNVAKIHSGEYGPKFAQHFNYYVDHDWALPIGYIYYYGENDDEWKEPEFRVSFWVRGSAGSVSPHLFYQGKEVGILFDSRGQRIAPPTCSEEMRAGEGVSDKPQQTSWTRVYCYNFNVRGWNQTGRDVSSMFGAAYLFNENPGEYEVRVISNARLVRLIKFTVGPRGRIENGIAAANDMHTNRVVVPVKVIGDQEGQWNSEAWKTDAFYGNPLKGFTPAQ